VATLPSVEALTPFQRHRAGWIRTLRRRLLEDTHLMLAVAIVTAAVIIELFAGDPAVIGLIPSGIAYILLQVILGRTSSPLGRPIPRLLAAVGYVAALGLFVGEVAARPTVSLYLPIVAMAAAYGRREAIIVGSAAIAAYAAPIVVLNVPLSPLLQRGASFIVVMVVLALGTRRTVGALEAAIARARVARAHERRRARQMAGVEAVGRLLASGASSEALDRLMDLMVQRFGYPLVSIYLLEDHGALRLGAQRGYDPENVIEVFDGTSGVVGRVMRTRQSVLIRDVANDPDYQVASSATRSEICVPLIAGGDLLGVLNVEHPEIAGLDESDRSTLVLVAERIAGAVALGRERAAIAERAALFQSLGELSTTINVSIEPSKLFPLIVEAVGDVLRSDIVVLTVRDELVGDYRIAAMRGGDQRFVGVRIPEGEGVSGRCIAERRVIEESRHNRERFPSTVQRADVQDQMTCIGAPMLSDDQVLGALTVSRLDLDQPYSRLEVEVLPIVAAHVALAIANAQLLAQVADAAIRDPLTGLFNRRHLDAALDRLLAARDRLDPGERRPVAAILFDLDHFGAFNKRHGHRTGDGVLRTFGSILNGRFRASDIVARYGGEEFLVVLDGASLDEATKAAEKVRRELEATPLQLEDGSTIHATVSAGCSAVGPQVSSMDSLLSVADVALQMAKRAGRNQIVAA
jgi:diguanylate cyclase (GGDEF)-like protein